jgi:NAD-dependent dihydropyrimidine dehydrogenase PreA subunit
MTVHKYLANVSTLRLDHDACTGCGVCTTVCPHAVFRIEEKKAVLANFNSCMECGACQRNCAFGALEVRAGVGCAGGIIAGFISGGEPVCSCGEDDGPVSCC